MLRILVVKPDTDLQKVLLRRPGAGSSASFERMKAMNPHVDDLRRPPVGTVLVVPAGPDVKTGAGEPLGDEDLKEFSSTVDSGLKEAVKRVRAGFERLDADHRAVAAALKTAALKGQIGEDPALKKRLQAAEAQFKSDQKRAAEVESQLADAQKLVMKELAALQKLFDV